MSAESPTVSAAEPSSAPCATVGIIVNPLAGTDVRRLVTGAAPMPDMAKVGIIRRAIIGASEGGATKVLLTDDRRSLSARALEQLERERTRDFDRASAAIEYELLPAPPFDARRNTVLAAQELHDRGTDVVIVLGGDGTHRDAVTGWRDATLLPVSTGTNNVFPRAVEATLAGHAAGAVACGRAPKQHVAWRAKVIDVCVEFADGGAKDGEKRDVALVDLAVVASDHIGSRAVWDATSLRELLCTIAEPASVGLSSIAAAAKPCGRRERGGVHVRLGTNGAPLRVPIAPGQYGAVHVDTATRIGNGEPLTLTTAPGAVLSIDGERDIIVPKDAQATATINNDGPYVVDVDAAMTAALASTAANAHSTNEQHTAGQLTQEND